MPLANVRGAKINYEVLGARGEWIALTPGGRLGLEHVRPIARLLADAGYRVLIHGLRYARPSISWNASGTGPRTATG